MLDIVAFAQKNPHQRTGWFLLLLSSQSVLSSVEIRRRLFRMDLILVGLGAARVLHQPLTGNDESDQGDGHRTLLQPTCQGYNPFDVVKK